MPHVIIKHFPKSLDDDRRARLAARITEAVREALDVDENVISIALRPVPPESWDTEVYRPDILTRPDLLIKHPDY
jgi:4-oxalocrotonate tautomerase